MTYQMNESCCGEPDTDERGQKLTETDTVAGLQYIEILQHVGNGHHAQYPGEAEAWNKNNKNIFMLTCDSIFYIMI